MKILVTGGAGFIGRHLVKRLLEEGHNVLCIDSLITGTLDNIAEFSKYPKSRFRFAKEDIRETLAENHIYDQVYNLACPASPIQFKNNAVYILETCSSGVQQMLQFAKSCNARFLQASTSEVYGDPEEHPQKETYNGNVNPLGERACYDVGKRWAETFCLNYSKERDVEVRIVRIFNTYGPFMQSDDGRVVSNFINQALKGENITVYGDGEQTRSFQYIDDLIDGLIMMMNQDEFIGPVNMGNPNEITINELAKKIIKLTGSGSQIVYKDLPEDDPKRRQPDITLAKEKLGWEPKIDLGQGLKRTIIEWPKSH